MGIHPTGNSRGRPKKASNIKLLENKRFKEIPKDEPRPTHKAPKVPSHLSPGALREWNRMKPKMLAVGLLTEMDQAAFAMYCQTYDELKTAEIEARYIPPFFETVNGYIVQHPIFGKINHLRSQLHRAITSLGLSPQSRTGTSVPQRDSESAYERWKKNKGKGDKTGSRKAATG